MKTVLLIEDDKEFANSCIEKLLENGFQVEYANNAELAKQIFIEKQIDILVIDLMLPPTLNIEGVDFYRFTKEHKSVPAIFMTSKSFRTTEIVAEAMQLGARDFLDKENKVFFDKLIFSVKNVQNNKIASKTNNKSTLFVILIYLLLFVSLIIVLMLVTYLITLMGLPFVQTFLVITTVTIGLLIIIVSSQLVNESKISEDTWLKVIKSRVINFPNQLLEKIIK